jgi:hypothetical protein
MKIYNATLALKYTVDNEYSSASLTSYIKRFVSPANETYYLLFSVTNATSYTLTVTIPVEVEIREKGFYWCDYGYWKWFALKMPKETTTKIYKKHYTKIYIYDEDLNLLVTAGYGEMDINNITVHKDTYILLKLYSPSSDYIRVFTPSEVSFVSPGTYARTITIEGADYGFYMNASVGEQIRLTLTGPAGTDANIYVYYEGEILARTKSTSYPDRVIFAAVRSGLYFVKVRSILGNGSFTVTYAKEAVPVLLEPETSLSEELAGYVGFAGYKFPSDGYHFVHLTLNSTTTSDLIINVYDPYGSHLLVHRSLANYPAEVSFNTVMDGDYIILISSKTGYLANYTLIFEGTSNYEVFPGAYSGSIGSSSSTSSLRAYAFHAPLGAIISAKMDEDSGAVIWIEGLDQRGLVKACNRTNIYVGTRTIKYASPMNGTAFIGLINKGLSGSYNITIGVQLVVLVFGENYDFRKPIISDISYIPKIPLPTDEVTVKAAVASLLNITVSVQLHWTIDDTTWYIQEMAQIQGGAYYETSIPPQPLFTQVKFKIVAEEADGDKQETKIYSYTVTETEPPTVQIISPEDGLYVNTTLISVAWSASDEISGLDKIEIYVDGSLNATFQPDQTSYLLTLAEGRHEIKVKAYDKAGNVAEDVVTVTVDLTAPTIQITNPEDGATLSGESVVVSWSASDNFGIREFQIYADDSLIATLDGSASSITLAFGTGSHTIRVVAIDHAGNSAYDEITITVPSTAPSTGGLKTIHIIGAAVVTVAVIGAIFYFRERH